MQGTRLSPGSMGAFVSFLRENGEIAPNQA